MGDGSYRLRLRSPSMMTMGWGSGEMLTQCPRCLISEKSAWEIGKCQGCKRGKVAQADGTYFQG